MRKTVARAALLLLAVAAVFAFGETVAAPAAMAARGDGGRGFSVRDDARGVVAAAVPGTDWTLIQQRAPEGRDQVVAVLLATALLVVASARRRVTLVACGLVAERRGRSSAIRGPPALV